VPICAQDGVRGVNGHAHPHQFVFMYFVAAALGQGFYQTNHADPGLKRMIPGNQPHIAAADDEQFFSRAHQIAVHQRLERSSAINTRQGISLERQEFFSGAAGYQ